MAHVHDWFQQTAGRFPNEIAIDAGDRSLTYAGLAARSNHVASFLQQCGVEAGSPVVVLSADSVHVIPVIIGILRGGFIFVPIDPALPPSRLKVLLQKINPALVVTESRHIDDLAAVAQDGGCGLRFACVDSDEISETSESLVYVPGLASFHDNHLLSVERNPDDACYIYFTSGSTGHPKGIVGRLCAIEHFVKWEIETLGVTKGTRVSQLTTPAFDAYLRDMFTPLCAGGTVCVPESRNVVLDAERLIPWLDQQRVQLIHCVPTVFRSILGGKIDDKLFPNLRHVVLAGEALLPVDVKRWTDVFGDRIQLVNLYGPSETTMTKFFHFVQRSDCNRRSVPIGRPMPGAEAMLLDENARPVANGKIGEICIRTRFRSLGYYEAPELTKAVFVKNPLNDDPEDLIYKTGDFGRVIEDDVFEFLGRRDNQVKIGGVRVELGEIENVVRGHPGVRDVVVVDQEVKAGEKFLCAYVVAESSLNLGELRSHATSSLPHTMVPAVFVIMESLPRTISGKVDRKALPAATEMQKRGESRFVAPRTPVEEKLAGLWSRVLGVSTIGVNDDFFLMGGNSLLAIRLLARVSELFQIEVPLRKLLAGPTISELAANLEEITLQNRG